MEEAREDVHQFFAAEEKNVGCITGGIASGVEVQWGQLIRYGGLQQKQTVNMMIRSQKQEDTQKTQAVQTRVFSFAPCWAISINPK